MKTIMTKEKIVEAVKMAKEGKSLEQIAKKFEVGKTAISNVFTRLRTLGLDVTFRQRIGVYKEVVKEFKKKTKK